MRWDIFCKVIDNHGDAGVCWRLACGLASTGQGAGDTVRLWIDDPAALAWMAPDGRPRVQVVHWREPLDASLLREPAPDVLIEAFGCDPAPELIAHYADAVRAGATNRLWINLEYLSAEPYVERLHGLPSPVFRGPGEGLTKYFFYPGFTPATGGLLHEDDLPARQHNFDRAQWLRERGIDWQGERLVSLFCYEPPPLGELLARLQGDAQPSRLLVTAGRATRAVQAIHTFAPHPAPHDALALTWLPHVPQPGFDHLLWACDLNFVRGEDSLVRALWAGAPFVWQIYPQDDDVHHVKLGAFLDWLQAPDSLREFHHVWNGFSIAPLVLPDAPTLEEWRQTVQAARVRLLEQGDLVTRLRRFVHRHTEAKAQKS
jgi:uncharacterized repeat protein (TIGR03837 family)